MVQQPSPDNLLNEIVIWWGRPNLLKAFIDCLCIVLIYMCIYIGTLLVVGFTYSRDQIFDFIRKMDFKYLYTIIVVIMLINLLPFVQFPFHHYTVTTRHIYAKKLRTWGAWEGEHIYFEYIDDPETVKDIVERARKEFKS